MDDDSAEFFDARDHDSELVESMSLRFPSDPQSPIMDSLSRGESEASVCVADCYVPRKHSILRPQASGVPVKVSCM